MKKILILLIAIYTTGTTFAQSNHKCNDNKVTDCSGSVKDVTIKVGGSYTPSGIKAGESKCDQCGENVKKHKITYDTSDVDTSKAGEYNVTASCSEGCTGLGSGTVTVKETYTMQIRKVSRMRMMRAAGPNGISQGDKNVQYTFDIKDSSGNVVDESNISSISWQPGKRISSGADAKVMTLDTSSPGSFQLKAQADVYTGTNYDTIKATESVTIGFGDIKVKSLLPDLGEEVDDGDSNPDTKLYIIARAKSGVIKVTAKADPVTQEKNLPPSWSMNGGKGSGLLERTVSLKDAAETKITASCGSSTKSVTIIVYKVTGMTELSFSGGHTLVSDNGTIKYGAPHWTLSSVGPTPIAFTRNTTYAASVKMSVTPEFPQGVIASVKIKGDGPSNMDVEAMGTIQKKTLTLPTTSASNSFPNTVKYYSDFSINWSVSYNNGRSWHSINTTTHKCYITQTAPGGITNYHTLFHIACENADGKSSEKDIFTGIWSYLKECHTQTHDGKKLHYYGVYSPGLSIKNYIQPNKPTKARRYDVKTTKGLLEHKDGKCGAWAYFMIDLLKVHGLKATPVTVKPDETKIIKYKPKNTSSYTEQVTDSAMFSAADIPGQNTKGAPYERCWIDHQFVRYNKKLYDPSYGGEYGTDKTNVVNSLKSYGWKVLVKKNGSSAKYDEKGFRKTEGAGPNNKKIK